MNDKKHSGAQSVFGLEQLNGLLERYANGESCRDIANDVGYDNKKLGSLLRKHSSEEQKNRRKLNKKIEEDKNKALIDYYKSKGRCGKVCRANMYVIIYRGDYIEEFGTKEEIDKNHKCTGYASFVSTSINRQRKGIRKVNIFFLDYDGNLNI